MNTPGNNGRDVALAEVATEIKRLDPTGSRWAGVIRHTYDQIYYGQETGRYRWDQLMKTEKTHFGTLFEINAQREFGFAGGKQTDFVIAGHQVDAKWSQADGAWMLPPEVFGELALVATGSDQESAWSLGLIRVTEQFRRETVNRDQKSQLNPLGRSSIQWLWRGAPLRPNVLLQLPREVVDDMLALRHGTQRVDQLFRVAEGMIVNRNVVATVSRQLDTQRRVRYNGGSRSSLQPEGYLILSGTYHSREIAALGLPPLLADEYVSVRVVPGPAGVGLQLAGKWWRRAQPGEAVTEAAPRITENG